MIFERVVCGVDGTPEGLAAARQGARLASPAGQLTLVTVVESNVAVHGGWRATALADQLRVEAEQALEEARAAIAAARQVETRLLDGALLPPSRPSSSGRGRRSRASAPTARSGREG